MSGPNGINRSNFTNQADPMNDMDGWLESDYEDYGGEGSTGWGEDYGQSGYQGMEGEGPVGMSGNEAVQQLLADFKQVKANPNLDVAEKNKQLKQIKALMDQAKSLGNKPISSALMNEISILEAEVIQSAPLEGAEEEGGDNSSNVQKSLDELKSKIQASDRIPESKKSELISKLERAKSNLDINPGESSLQSAADIIAEVQQEFDDLMAMPKAAIDLASKLNLSPEEIKSAAENAGVNLDNLPKPPDEKVMKMLNELGIPDQSKIDEFNQIKDERKTKMQELKSKLQAQDEEWHRETENPPSQSDFSTSYKYYSRQDDLYKQMEGKEKEMQGSIVDALNALGYSASAGASPDQIKLDGSSVVDFFNEKTGTFGFSTTLTDMGGIQTNEDFYPAPRNTESSDEGHIQDMGDKPGGYPEVTYTVD